MEEYIQEQNKRYAMNIDSFAIGQIVLYQNKVRCTITNKTINSIEVLMPKTNEKGVNALQWFDMQSFNKTFKSL